MRSVLLRALLSAILIWSAAPFAIADDYSRCEFGCDFWQRDKMNTRHLVLKLRARGQLTVYYDGNHYKVIRGTFVDEMTGEVLVDINPSGVVEIDHIVPLHWAWLHGADRWSRKQRRQFANDTSFLIVTRKRNNASKSDLPLDEYLPINRRMACTYSKKFNDALDKYPFEISETERFRFGEIERRACSGLAGTLS